MQVVHTMEDSTFHLVFTVVAAALCPEMVLVW